MVTNEEIEYDENHTPEEVFEKTLYPDENEELIKYLNKLDKYQQKELFLLHNDKHAIEQWLIDYYNNETFETLKADLERCNIEVN